MLDTILPFQTWLKQQRKLSGFTQNDLAEHLSCTTSLVRKLESGIRTPSLLIARKLAQIFEIDSSEYPLFISWCLHAPEIPTSITPQSPYPKPNTFKTSPRLLLTHSLIGRQKEIAWIEAFFRKQRGRLLTLVGFSGIGKTSLGLTIGNRLQQYYKTIKVDLEGIDRSDLVLIAISQYLGLGGTTHDIIQAAFQHIIGTENLLLIIDPFEHVLDAAEVIQDILQWCPNMMILVTSQVPLHLREECIYYLRPLSMPKPITSTIHELEQSHAGSLMLERLREHRPHWHIADNQAQSLAYICRSIDGIPLAIELLALRLRWITPQQLRDYINSDYALAQRPLNTVHQRHQSLEYTIERSYELLPEHAQQLFQHLSILADGWNLDEVYHICRALRISNHDTIQKVIQHVEILLERGFILPLDHLRKPIEIKKHLMCTQSRVCIV